MVFETKEQAIAALIEAGKNDQKVRNEFPRGVDGWIEKWGAVDAQNQKILGNVVNFFGGWENIEKNKDEFNEKSLMAFYMIAQHSDLELIKKSFIFLSGFGNLPDYMKGNLATMEDRILRYEGKPQKYGSQIKYEEIHAIEGIDMEKLMAGDRVQEEIINSRRKAVGLGPIREYAAKHGVEIKIPGGKPID